MPVWSLGVAIMIDDLEREMDTCGGVARDIAWPLCRVNARDELRCLAAQIHCKNAFWRCETPNFRRAARGKFSNRKNVINSVSVRTRGRSLRSSNPNYDSRFARRGGRDTGVSIHVVGAVFHRWPSLSKRTTCQARLHQRKIESGNPCINSVA